MSLRNPDPMKHCLSRLIYYLWRECKFLFVVIFIKLFNFLSNYLKKNIKQDKAFPPEDSRHHSDELGWREREAVNPIKVHKKR